MGDEDKDATTYTINDLRIRLKKGYIPEITGKLQTKEQTEKDWKDVGERLKKEVPQRQLKWDIEDVKRYGGDPRLRIHNATIYGDKSADEIDKIEKKKKKLDSPYGISTIIVLMNELTLLTGGLPVDWRKNIPLLNVYKLRKKRSKEREKEREAMGNEDTDAPERFLSKKEQDALETSLNNKYKKLKVDVDIMKQAPYFKLTVKEGREKDKKLDPEKRMSVWIEKAMIRKLKELNDGKIPRNWTTAYKMVWFSSKIPMNESWTPGAEDPVESEDEYEPYLVRLAREKKEAMEKQKRGSGMPKKKKQRLDKLLGYD